MAEMETRLMPNFLFGLYAFSSFIYRPHHHLADGLLLATVVSKIQG